MHRGRESFPEADDTGMQVETLMFARYNKNIIAFFTPTFTFKTSIRILVYF
jgi:hypothetical protein